MQLWRGEGCDPIIRFNKNVDIKCNAHDVSLEEPLSDMLKANKKNKFENQKNLSINNNYMI